MARRAAIQLVISGNPVPPVKFVNSQGVAMELHLRGFEALPLIQLPGKAYDAYEALVSDPC